MRCADLPSGCHLGHDDLTALMRDRRWLVVVVGAHGPAGIDPPEPVWAQRLWRVSRPMDRRGRRSSWTS
jgi:hypothetical protein